MTLIVIKKHSVYDLPTLWRIALKSVFDSENLTTQEFDLMMSSLIDWNNHLNLKKDGLWSAIDEENHVCLEIIAKLLKDNEDGLLDERKENYRKHGINYLKAYEVPGSWTPGDFARAQELHKSLPKEDQ